MWQKEAEDSSFEFSTVHQYVPQTMKCENEWQEIIEVLPAALRFHQIKQRTGTE